MLTGCGVGFSVQKHHIAKLPALQPRHKQAKTHVISDSIEGWAEALDVLLSSFFVNGGKHPEYAGRKIYFDFTKIRAKGSYISGGFRAPGPEPLRNALNKIENLLVSVGEQKRQLKSIEAYDVIMHAADSVISGGIRRAATICTFSEDDEDMLKAKTGNWFTENPQRARSNNSVVLLKDKITKERFTEIMRSVKEFGEPGFIFVNDLEALFNPCVEIGLYGHYEGKTGFQTCNLTEINGSSCDTKELFLENCKAAAILGTLQAGYTDFKFVTETTRKLVEREALIGVSITGWMNNPKILLDEETLREGAALVKKINKIIAKLINIRPAARTTTTKPSGNASVLLQTASGIHGEHSKRYIRHVQMNKDTEIAALIHRTNPAMVEESVWSPNKTDYVLAFPHISKEGTIFKKDLYGTKLLEVIKKVQANWVEAGTNVELCINDKIRHNVSNTVQVDDWEKVTDYIFENRQYYAGISLLGLTGDKDYSQAPNTEVLTGKEILAKYGEPSLFASGLITAGLEAFNNDLWSACLTAIGYGEDISGENRDTLMKRDFVRRFDKFAETYFNGDAKKTEYCLKDVYLLHKWNKIQNNLNIVDIGNELKTQQLIDIDTMGSQACAAGQCEI